jgi:23S rRNA (guanine745-N1)-methyltransferase
MIDGALPYLRCPICRQALARAERTLRCPLGHSFDMAKQGYADLTAGRMPHVGDTTEMVADRADFLAAGHYDFIAEALAADALVADALASDAARPLVADAPASEAAGPLVVDAGVGTGHYLARVLDAAPDATGLGLDVAKPALRRAARAHPRAAAVLADLWRPLPLADACASVILNVFAPRNGPEFHRILRPDGLLLVVTPATDHLHELIAAHNLIQVDPDKAARVGAALGDDFKPDGAGTLRRELHLSAAEARTLIGMTPSARHVPAATLPTTPVTVTAAVDVTIYRPR